jgi:hypothetical protein
MKFKIMNIAGKLIFVYNVLISKLYLSVFYVVSGAFAQLRNCAFVFVLLCFVCFRSRSHPVPHRGERVKQGTVHPRNIVLSRHKTFYSALGQYRYNCAIMYLIWLKLFAKLVHPHAMIWFWINLNIYSHCKSI